MNVFVEQFPAYFGKVVDVFPSDRPPSVLVICEHASNRIPDSLNALGLADDVLMSHVAWDIGAMDVAKSLARRVSGVLVCSNISRLVYDCNRPPDVPSAMPERSEIYDILGNSGLTPDQCDERVTHVYRPFFDAIREQIHVYRDTLRLLVTVHSFSPTFNGVDRQKIELGLLHGRDARFAEAMMRCLPRTLPLRTHLNEPYSAFDGVTHTLDTHGLVNNLFSVMIEIRNDLIRSSAQQDDVAALLAPWIQEALQGLTMQDT